MPQIRSNNTEDRFEHPGQHWLNNPEIFLTLGYLLFALAGVLIFGLMMEAPAVCYVVGFPAAWLMGLIIKRVRQCYSIVIDDVKAAVKRSSALAKEKLYLVRLLQANFQRTVGKAKYLTVWPWMRSTNNSVDFIGRSLQNIIEHLEEIEWFDALRQRVHAGTASQDEVDEYTRRKGEINIILGRINGEIAEIPDMADMLTHWKGWALFGFKFILWASFFAGILMFGARIHL